MTNKILDSSPSVTFLTAVGVEAEKEQVGGDILLNFKETNLVMKVVT